MEENKASYEAIVKLRIEYKILCSNYLNYYSKRSGVSIGTAKKMLYKQDMLLMVKRIRKYLTTKGMSVSHAAKLCDDEFMAYGRKTMDVPNRILDFKNRYAQALGVSLRDIDSILAYTSYNELNTLRSEYILLKEREDKITED